MCAEILNKVEKERHEATKPSSNTDHWNIRRDDNNILWLYFDKKDSSANTIGKNVLEELDDILSKAG